MGRRGRGQRTFNPNKERDVGQEVVDKFDDTWSRLSKVIRDGALGRFAVTIKKDRDIGIGEAMLQSMVDEMVSASTSIERKVRNMALERSRLREMVRKEDEEIARSLQVSREAADAAFPGVEDDDE
jgi:hypothetical protein